MKATLTFNLPEEIEEFTDANNGLNYKIFIQELFSALRTEIKHGSASSECKSELEGIRKMLYEMLSEYGISDQI